MDIAEQLNVLQAAQGHPAKLALATVDLAYRALTESAREPIRAGLAAAAVPHWCSSAILARLLTIPESESSAVLAQLGPLSVVEPFPARGENVVNVHESSRLAIRKWMAAEDSTRFRDLSARAADFFVSDATPSGRIEWIYHMLCADPERGADALEKLDREWSNQARPEERYAFAAALKELEDTKLVSGRARLWVILAVAWARATRGEYALLAETAEEALALARTVGDNRAEGDAQWLLGNVLMAKGNLPEAHQAFERNLEISRALAEQNPHNEGWQRELGAAYAGAGRVAAEQGKAKLAEEACGRAVEIFRDLVARNPAHPVWQQDLASALTHMGDLLQARGELSEAKTKFLGVLEIIGALSRKDPMNASWQLELALAHSRVGDVLQAEHKIEEAEEEYVQAREISESLTLLDLTHAGWQLRLSVAYNRVGNVLQLQHKLAGAQEEFGRALAITRALAKKSPGDAQWQRELAIALTRVGDVLLARGNVSEAQAALAEALEIHRRLAAQDSTRVEWQRDLAWAYALSARGFRLTDPKRALSDYDEAVRILGALADAHGSAGFTAEKEAIAIERAQLLDSPSQGRNQK